MIGSILLAQKKKKKKKGEGIERRIFSEVRKKLKKVVWKREKKKEDRIDFGINKKRTNINEL